MAHCSGVIHSTAIIHPKATLDPSVEVGPYVVIEEAVTIGPGCVLGPHVHITGVTVIGSGNRFHAGCVIGDAPQDLKYSGAPTPLRIGDNNVFREHLTVHRSNHPDTPTVIGSNNLFMAHAHVGHNAVVGDHVIIANGALLAGHAEVHDRAFISGNCLIHQFTRVGTLAMMQGGSAVSLDVPPFAVATGRNSLCGLNIVGLRRAGISPGERLELKKLYRLIFRSGHTRKSAIEEARSAFLSRAATVLLDFMAASKRGVCSHKSAALNGASEELEG